MNSSLAGKAKPNKGFADKIFSIIGAIPKGKVLTYGQVATLAGVPRAARIVGGLLYQQGLPREVPWQRVLNAQGKLSTYRVGMGEEQRRLLEGEGLIFDIDGAIDLKKHQWIPDEDQLVLWEVDEETCYRILEIGRF